MRPTLAGLLLALAAPAPLPAAGAVPPSPDTAAASRQEPPSGDLVSRLDSLVRARMDRGGIPGMALVVVQNGRTVAARGYGVADRSSGRPVSPDSTRFALGSMSKLVTAVAALQQRETGRLDLHAPAGRHLPAGLIPEGPGGPVTLHHLLTHTAGLESASVGLAARDTAQLVGLEEYLSARDFPRRVRPPGELYLYSQHGYGVAGLAVQRASGTPFARYAEERVFEPLGMDGASFRPRALTHPRTASGYLETGEGLRPVPPAFHQIPPAGALVATPREMASLMTALMRGGATEAGRILPADAAREMLRRQWSPHPHPAVEGAAYGLFGYRSCGLRAVTTRGWVGGHVSYLHLVPGEDLGMLVTANASTLGGLESTLRHALHAERAGRDCESGVTGKRGEVPDEVAGHYRSLRFASSGVESLGRAFLAGEVTVRPTGDGSARVGLGGSRVEALPVARRVLAAEWGEGQEEIFAFLEGGTGAADYMMWGGAAYERVSLLGRRSTARALAGLAMAVFLSGLIVPAVQELRKGAGDGSGLRRAGAALSLLWLLFAAGLAYHLAGASRYQFAYGVPDGVLPFLWIPVPALALAAALAAGGAKLWKERRWPLWERLQWSCVAATGLVVGGWSLAAGLVPL